MSPSSKIKQSQSTSLTLQTATHYLIPPSLQEPALIIHTSLIFYQPLSIITMKFSYQAYLLLLTALISPAALGQPVDGPDDPGNDPDSAPHNKNGAAVANPGVQVTDVDKAKAAGKTKCFTFTSDNPNWGYTMDRPWSGSGKFGKGPKKICVPHNDDAGGAMFIGSEAHPGPGNTKFECFIPSAGKGNCDISLVDGYSLSVTCEIQGGHKVGGGKNLWKQGKECNDKSLLSRGICKNDKGPGASKQSDVAPFFREGVQDKNYYCIWWKCGQDYFFNVGADIKCHVSGGRNA